MLKKPEGIQNKLHFLFDTSTDTKKILYSKMNYFDRKSQIK